MDATKIVKEAHDSGKLLIGSRSVIKGLKSGSIRQLICSSNCPENYRKVAEAHAKESATELVEFKGDSVRLGETCGKPFTVLMVGVKK
jgi:large subunit ribosomal protein L30e